MKNILVYFPYELQKNPKSGSGVRPKKIVEAFGRYAANNDLELIVISGQSAERAKKIDQFRKQQKAENTLFCYMENSTIPFWLTDKDHLPRKPLLDTTFWSYLKSYKIPISCFYRDVYWKFDEMYVPPGNKKIFTPIMRVLYQQELKAYHKAVDLLYLPSLEMNKYVEWKKDFSEMPPGMDKLVTTDEAQANPACSLESPHPAITTDKEPMPKSQHYCPKAVFVGGITDQKGILLMLEAFRALNATNTTIQLEMVCREQEFRKDPEIQAYQNEPWLTVSHKSGAELQDVYRDATIALIPREQNIYHDFAVPVKMFEYLSFGLPIVATNCAAHARIIEKDEVGVISEDDSDSFAEAVKKAIEPALLAQMQHNIRTKAALNHTWDARIEKIVRDMAARRELS